MSNDTLLFLAVSQNTDSNTYNVCYGEERIQQYINGIKKLFEYDFSKKADVMICDNTTKNLDKRIVQALPSDTLYLTYENNLGKDSKSVGLCYQWKSSLEEINKYKWVIHFEPRQLLKSHLFFHSFFKDKRNLFNLRGDQVWTGLFSLETKLLDRFIQQTNIDKRVPVESVMLDFMENYSFEDQDLDLLWNIWAYRKWVHI